MNTTQETSVTSSQDRFTTVEVLRKGTKINGERKADCNNVRKSTIEELFPWTTEFKKKCRCLLAQPNIVALIKLMKFYARNVSINVNECYTKPYRAAKLKDSISETLLFFLFYFRELVEVCDKNSYLDKMSDILAMYLDMELKASRRGKEHHSKIAARLTSCLYVYLENSCEHILDTFIKARFINRNYHDILDPVLTKISKNLPTSPSCDTMYVRYLLIYRLWKKVNNDAAVKNQINTTAIVHLGPPPQNPTPFLTKYVLPKVPKSQANSTKFLLQHKFDIEKSCRLFIQYCKENREDEEQGDINKPNFIANTLGSDTLEMLGASGLCRVTNHVENLIDNVNILPEGERRQQTPIKALKPVGKNETGELSALKPLRPGKVLPRLKTKKNGDILFIDLTADEITEKVIKKKKHLKLHWLTRVKKKLNSKNIKAAEKKKKTHQIMANNSSDDLNISGFVDSTSAGSLSTATTPEPVISSGIITRMGKSLSTATTPEPENCVTTNFSENEFTLQVNSLNLNDAAISKLVEKQRTCDVTTTVTESSSKLESSIIHEASESLPNSDQNISQLISVNHLIDNSCHTTTEKHEINSQNTETSTINKLSNALSHICESYDSDHSALDASSSNYSNCDANVATVTKTVKTDTGGSKNIPIEEEKVSKTVGVDEDSDKSHEEGQKSYSERTELVQISEKSSQVYDSLSTEISDDVDLRLYRNEINAANEDETLMGEEQQAKLATNKFESGQNTLEKLDTSKSVSYDVKKSCDHKSSSGDTLEFGRKEVSSFADRGASSIRKKYNEEQASIPKINEVISFTKNNENDIPIISNELLASQEPQFNDNIDGLSLLASVSQHVSHLEEYCEKSLLKPKITEGEIGRINSEGKSNTVEKMGDTNSYEILLDLHVNVSDKNEIVGVSYEVDDNKLNAAALKLEDRKGESHKIGQNDSLDVVPLILETTVDLNSSTLHNNLISVENVTQMIKESTNVIVNGETVVLFQKSPNSNLYIINKAADGTMERLADDKKAITVKKTEKNSVRRDIINHIPINLSEKNIDRQIAGGKNNHRLKVSGSNKNRRSNDSGRKDESLEILSSSKQFKPICEEDYIKKEILNAYNYEENFLQRCTDTPGSVIELEPVKKSPPPIIRLTDTPVDIKMLINHKEIYEESCAINMVTTGRLNEERKIIEKIEAEGTLNENFQYNKQNIKKEFDNNLSDELNSGDSQQVTIDNYDNINLNVNHSNLSSINSILSSKIPHDYSTVTKATNFYNIERERCDYPSCNLKLNSSAQSYPSVTNCQLAHCTCLKCAYEVHCGQYIQRSAINTAHPSYLQTNSYFLSADPTGKPQNAAEEKDLKLNEAVLAKLNNDELLHNIEQSIRMEKREINERNVVKIGEQMKYKAEFENKLPLKKRLKAHAMLSMSYDGAPIKIEKVENYPGTPMMSIAALETGNISQSNIYQDKPTSPSNALELSPRVKEDSFSHSTTTEMIRRDYLKDTSLTSIGNCANVDDRVKKFDHQRRQTNNNNSHVNIMGTGCQRSFKTPAQRKEVVVSSPSSLSLKRSATIVANHPKSPKKGKKAKTMGNIRQTRSSKRNIPKVDYSYDGIIDTDSKYNALSEMRRKRKKTSR